MFISEDSTPRKALINNIDQISSSNVAEEVPASDLLEESSLEEAQENYNSLVSKIKSDFERAKDKRFVDETRWLECWRNYRGVYGPDTAWRDNEKSKAFIKITKTKVLAAAAQIMDVLMAGQKFPIGIQPTKVPNGIPEKVHIETQKPQESQQKQPKGVRPELLKLSQNLSKRLGDMSQDIEEGAGGTATSIEISPAEEAAMRMEKKIHDQLEEASASKHLQRTVLEMALFGHGILKGPFKRDKEYPRWTKEGAYDPIILNVPDVSHTSIWNNYPDPDAVSDDDCELWIERHKMSRTALRGLKKRPFFDSDAIEFVISEGPNYIKEYWEDIIEDSSESDGSIQRWEVIEFWGIVDKELAEENGIDFDKRYNDVDQVQINAWVCGNTLIRCVLNPFNPARIPYHSCPYEINPYSFFGIGVAENMLDTQLLMNGFMRLAVDNAAISSNVIFELNEDAIVSGQDLTMYPGKVIKKNGGFQGKAIESITIPNITQPVMMMFDKARQLADESTGMPSYSHGMAGVMNVGRTASGMSMLMNAAAQNIKAVVRNIDEYILTPLGKALFAFNMQFNFSEDDIVGDVEIVAKGTESLMRNEVRSQKLLQFLQITANPTDAPFVKRHYILSELASSLDLDKDEVVNDPAKALIQAKQIKEMNEAMGAQQQMQAAQQGSGPMPGLSDQRSVNTGMAPGPDEGGFTGTGGGDNGGNVGPPPQGTQ